MDISRAKYILDYWFSKGRYTPDYDKWFMKSQDYDEEIREKFGDLLKEAEQGKGFGWLHTKDSYVAYIILLDQFSRHIYRGKGDAFKNDNGVMLFAELGYNIYKEQLVGYEYMFAFMPFLHSEVLGYQKKGALWFRVHKEIYGDNSSFKRRITSPSETATHGSINILSSDKEYNMLKSMEPHVKGHYETIHAYGRFPKRNAALGRESTPQEIEYMEREDVKKRPY
mgnify:CR=1 FL=1|jgi:uncharacterized protein (DUF924 family)|uniref:DUF924 domain-containing protein n=1 Tax=viral metagenome TaxID=1070528 RepID=A0A6C0ITU7_9ZZZZ